MFSKGFVPITNDSISPIIVRYRFEVSQPILIKNKTVKLIAAKIYRIPKSKPLLIN